MYTLSTLETQSVVGGLSVAGTTTTPTKPPFVCVYPERPTGKVPFGPAFVPVCDPAPLPPHLINIQTLGTGQAVNTGA